MKTRRRRVSTLSIVAVLGAVTLAAGLSFALVAHADNSSGNAAAGSRGSGSQAKSAHPAASSDTGAQGGVAIEAQNQPGNQGYLGLSVQDDNGKLTVASVVAGGPAEKAGVKQGDVITAVNGANVASFIDLKKALGGKHPGDSVALAISRGGNAQNLTVTLGDAAAAGIPARPGGQGKGALPGFAGIGAALSQGFDRFISVETKTKDANGQVHTDTVVGGTVKSVSGNSVVVTLNSGSGDQTFTVDGNTRVIKGPHSGQKQQQGAAALAQNDKALVATRDGSTTASWIFVVDPNGFGFFHGRGGGQGNQNGQGGQGGISFGPNGSINITLPGGQSITVPGQGNANSPVLPPPGNSKSNGGGNRSPFGNGSRGPAY
ncbi:MAG TPA: PDZ domain-containing protein [Dehalococcoidia bacterium]|nr:PDZ domain-containing protein [Dehalococcoidia bacterium]